MCSKSSPNLKGNNKLLMISSMVTALETSYTNIRQQAYLQYSDEKDRSTNNKYTVFEIFLGLRTEINCKFSHRKTTTLNLSSLSGLLPQNIEKTVYLCYMCFLLNRFLPNL